MTEEFVFDNPKECLDSAMRPTEYEQTHGIVATGCRIIFDDPELKIAVIEKSDNSVTLAMAIKKAKNKNLWVNWVPTKNQFKIFCERMPEIIKIVERENLDKRSFQW